MSFKTIFESQHKSIHKASRWKRTCKANAFCNIYKVTSSCCLRELQKRQWRLSNDDMWMLIFLFFHPIYLSKLYTARSGSFLITILYVQLDYVCSSDSKIQTHFMLVTLPACRIQSCHNTMFT